MYAASFSLRDRSVSVEAPDRFRAEMRTAFGRAAAAQAADGQTRIAMRDDGADRFAVAAPYGGSVSGLGAAEVLPVLLEEIVRALVFELESGVALHAGAVAWRDKLVLVVGPSHAGKSSLVAWLASNGFDYLCDELVVLSEDGAVEPFDRPLVVKPGARAAVAALSLGDSARAVEVGDNLIVAPKRRRRKRPVREVGLVIFVRHDQDADLEIEPLSPARCVLRLMECNLNARNLGDHGLEAVRRLATTTPAITLRYGAFEQLGGAADRLVKLILGEGWRPAESGRFLSAFGAAGGRRSADKAAAAAPAAPKAFPIPEATTKRLDRKLTIGMATYDDFDGVYFTIQALRLYHAEVMDDVELLVVDNRPDGPCGEALKKLEDWIENYRYVPFIERTGTAIRDAVFREAGGRFVLCVDCHVFIAPDGVRRLLDYYDRNPETPDLLQGPMVYDDLRKASTHFVTDWRSGMYGKWADSRDVGDLESEPFEIPMQGLGLFSCRKAVWPGFNREFRGFGGEEFYIHEKFRQAGARALCLPFLRWLHRFPRPMGVPYPNTWEDRIRNYLIGLAELGLPTTEMEAHFTEVLGKTTAARLFAEVRRELRLDDRQAAE